MITKTLEIRDEGTCIPILAIKLTPGCERDRYLLERAGYETRAKDQECYVQLCQINGGDGLSHCDPYKWHSRTMHYAHIYIKDNFDALEPGAVIDVEWILGLCDEPKESEYFLTNQS